MTEESSWYFSLSSSISIPTVVIALTGNYYFDYQFFLYETIAECREKGKTFNQIAGRLNSNRYLSVRVKKFSGYRVHSIFRRVNETRASASLVRFQHGSR